MADYKRVTIVLPTSADWDIDTITAAAEKRGITRNEFMTKSIEFMLNIDDTAWNMITNYSKGLKVPENVIVQNILIKRAAEQAAQMEAYGRITNGVLDEFISVSKDQETWEMLTGEELFKVLKDKYVREYKKQIKDKEEKLNSYK